MSQLGFSFGALSIEVPVAQTGARPLKRQRAKPRAVQLSLLDHRPAELEAPPQIAPQKQRTIAPPREEQRPPIKDQARLEQALRAQIGREVIVSLTSNTSTMISFRRRGRALYVRVHRMFGQAPDEVVSALASFIAKDRTSKKEAKLLDSWIERHRPTLTEARAKAVQPQPYGEIHDLQTIFDQLNKRYFNGSIDAQITWTRAAKQQKRTSIHMGTYSDELRLIRIHPALDQAFVPTYFVEFVVFHEMLHQVHNVKAQACGRREVHSPAFRKDEQRFERYREARDWERQNLKRLLRY